MKIFVKAKPSSKEERVEKIDDTHFVIAVREPPVQGRANAAIIKVLAGYLGVSISSVRLISGFSSKEKTFSLDPHTQD